MRLILALGLLAPVGVVVLLALDPGVLRGWSSQLADHLAPTAAAGAFAMSATALLVYLWIRLRFEYLLRTIERLAEGDSDVEVRIPSGSLEGRLGRAIAGVAEAMSSSQEAATVDKLTGVANRHVLLVALINEVERATRYNHPLSVAFVDIDLFKNVNDTYGHAAGDVVLRAVAQEIKANLRGTDLVGRYGGEEFMLLLTETNVEDAAVLAEKLRQLVGRLRFDVEGNPDLQVTISIGIAGGAGPNLRFDALVRDADAAMYSAKALGRNQTYIFAEPDEDARVPRAPISAAGRARAVEVGRAARAAATAAITSVIAPLPHYRGQPSALIASIVTDMGRHLDLPDADIDRLTIAALLHDVGKVAVPEEILEKPSSLTSTEWRSVVQHPRIGQVILEQATALKDAVPIILHHHERYSGHGYPYGLRGNDIPLGARIVAIADAYDAMIHDRPYKRAMSHEEAIAELRRHAGTQFDPQLVALFCDLYATEAPAPDPNLVAMTSGAHGHSALTVALTAADAAASRRRRAASRSARGGGAGAPDSELASG